jgi:pimeloyl-ACP methyl ester carboxylesterase
LKENNIEGKIIIMGRSLGSASALEICSYYHEKIDGLIVESGFAYAIPLLLRARIH